MCKLKWRVTLVIASGQIAVVISVGVLAIQITAEILGLRENWICSVIVGNELFHSCSIFVSLCFDILAGNSKFLFESLNLLVDSNRCRLIFEMK